MCPRTNVEVSNLVNLQFLLQALFMMKQYIFIFLLLQEMQFLYSHVMFVSLDESIC